MNASSLTCMMRSLQFCASRFTIWTRKCEIYSASTALPSLASRKVNIIAPSFNSRLSLSDSKYETFFRTEFQFSSKAFVRTFSKPFFFYSEFSSLKLKLKSEKIEQLLINSTNDHCFARVTVLPLILPCFICLLQASVMFRSLIHRNDRWTCLHCLFTWKRWHCEKAFSGL